jgi:hypothetical protein
MESDELQCEFDRIGRAAEGMIANYGKDALAESARRAQTMRVVGCTSSAEMWESVFLVIQGRIGNCPIPGSTLLPDSRDQTGSDAPN